MPAASSTQRCAAVAEPTRDGAASERERTHAAAFATSEVEGAKRWRSAAGNAASDPKHVDEVPHFPATPRGGYEILQVEIRSGSPINLVSESTAEACGFEIVVDDFGYDDYIDCDESFNLPSCIVGLTSFRLFYSGYEMWFDGFVVEDGYMDVDITAGVPFMEHNDLSVRPAKHKIMFGDELVFTYSDLTVTVDCGDMPAHTVVSDVHVMTAQCERVYESVSESEHPVSEQCDLSMTMQLNESVTHTVTVCEGDPMYESELIESDPNNDQDGISSRSVLESRENDIQLEDCVRVQSNNQSNGSCGLFLENEEEENDTCEFDVYQGDTCSFDHINGDDLADFISVTNSPPGIMTTSGVGPEVDCPGAACPIREPSPGFPCTKVSSVTMVTEHSSEFDLCGDGALPSPSVHSICPLVSTDIRDSSGFSIDVCTLTPPVIDLTCVALTTEPSSVPHGCTSEYSSSSPMIITEPCSGNPVGNPLHDNTRYMVPSSTLIHGSCHNDPYMDGCTYAHLILSCVAMLRVSSPVHTLMRFHPSSESVFPPSVETVSSSPSNTTPPGDHHKCPITSADGETPYVPHYNDGFVISSPVYCSTNPVMTSSALDVTIEYHDQVHQLDCHTPSPDVSPPPSGTVVTVLNQEHAQTPNCDDTLSLHLSADDVGPVYFDTCHTWNSFPRTVGHHPPSFCAEGGSHPPRPPDGALHLSNWMMATKNIHTGLQSPTCCVTVWSTMDVNCSPVPWIANPPAPPVGTGFAVLPHPPLSPVTPG